MQVAMPDSGWFEDWDKSKPFYSELTYGAELREIFWLMNATDGVNAACIAAHRAAGGDLANCMFAEYTAPFSA